MWKIVNNLKGTQRKRYSGVKIITDKSYIMKTIQWGIGLIFLLFLSTAFESDKGDWGFFAHRRINRLAVFTLPEDLIGFYKKHIEYITAHATDPDMRRYVVPSEGAKHFIDLDRWYDKNLPTTFREVRMLFAETVVINSKNDTVRLFGQRIQPQGDYNMILKGADITTFFEKDSIVLLTEDYVDFYREHIYTAFYDDRWKVNCDSLTEFFNFHGFDFDCQKAYAVDTFVNHGILPYNLVRMQYALKDAMLEENLDKILRVSADIGHYIGDAHVPLHTTSNYNGQQTDQIGIHAFWETRLPEMFADDNYDFLVGQADYILEIDEHYWKMVQESHALVEDVLGIEKSISKIYPEDQQDCFVERGEGYIQKMACEEYAQLYHEKLNGQVEQRFRDAIKAVGDAWFTAWIDAGQPDLEKIFDNRNKKAEQAAENELKKAARNNTILGRAHEN